MNGHYCDNCETHLDDKDFDSYGSWSYTCHDCGFRYIHGRSLDEQLDKFNQGKEEINFDDDEPPYGLSFKETEV